MGFRTASPLTSLALGLAATFWAAGAHACTDLSQFRLPSAYQSESLARFAAAASTPALVADAGNGDAAVTAGDAPPLIVGFWKFAFTAPDGVTTIDAGFQQWHEDGTEITNSGRPAITGNFCLGAWRRSGHSGYQLNHWAMAWDPNGDPMEFGGLINIREHVDVDLTGNKMKGTVSLDLYTPDGTTLLAHLADGSVTGTRISP